MPVTDADFKHAMSHFASGVTIVTTEHVGKPYGMTVSSFASLSLHPPLVLVHELLMLLKGMLLLEVVVFEGVAQGVELEAKRKHDHEERQL